MRAGAFPVNVEAAAVELAPLVGDVVLGVACRVHESLPEAGGLVGFHAFPTHVPVEEFAGPEGGRIAV